MSDTAREQLEALLQPDALMDVKVRVWAEIGRTRMPLADAVALSEGILVDLDREHHEPIDLFVNGLHYGRGRLVMVEGEWALTVDEIIATDASVERLSSAT
jgi:flagellar motor switch protein FliN/FliY